MKCGYIGFFPFVDWLHGGSETGFRAKIQDSARGQEQGVISISESCVKLDYPRFYIGGVFITVNTYQDLTVNYLWNKSLCYHGGKLLLFTLFGASDAVHLTAPQMTVLLVISIVIRKVAYYCDNCSGYDVILIPQVTSAVKQ